MLAYPEDPLLELGTKEKWRFYLFIQREAEVLCFYPKGLLEFRFIRAYLLTVSQGKLFEVTGEEQENPMFGFRMEGKYDVARLITQRRREFARAGDESGKCNRRP